MSMTAILAAAVWLSAISRRPTSTRREPGAWALSGTLAALAMGLTLTVPAVYAAVEAASDVPNLPQLLKNTCVVLSAFGTQVVLLYLLHPAAAASTRARRHAVITVVTVTVMTGALLAARPVADSDAMRSQFAEPGFVQSRSIYLAFLAWAFIDIARLCWRFSTLAGDRLLAMGLRLIALGGVVGLGYVAAGALQIVAAGQQDLALVQRTQDSSDALIGLSTLLVVLGSTLSPVMARLTPRRPRSTHEAAPAELQTLWRGVTQQLPEFVLPPAARAGLTGREELYRQVIEVEDARRALRPLRSEAIERAATQAVEQHGVDDSQREVAAEGVALALVVDLLRMNVTPASPEKDVDADPPVPWSSAGVTAGSLDSEVDRLGRVGRWYDDRPLVDTARWLLATHSNAARL